MQEAAAIFKKDYSHNVTEIMAFTDDDVECIFISGYDFNGEGRNERGYFKYSTLEKI